VRATCAGFSPLKRSGAMVQPGSSWAPQAIAALPALGVAPHGVPCYVDEGDHVGLNQAPFWYVGAAQRLSHGRKLHPHDLHDPAALEPARRRFPPSRIVCKSTGRRVDQHLLPPCEWCIASFGTPVNFSRGANPPPEQWKEPPQRPAAETEAAFQRFGQYLDHLYSLTNVGFVTASDLPMLKPGPVRQSIGKEREGRERDFAGPVRVEHGQIAGRDEAHIRQRVEVIEVLAEALEGRFGLGGGPAGAALSTVRAAGWRRGRSSPRPKTRDAPIPKGGSRC